MCFVDHYFSFCSFLLVIVLSGLFRFTAFNYHILIFKLSANIHIGFLQTNLFATGLLLASEKFDANICVS
jgi:hypothetical protein